MAGDWVPINLGDVCTKIGSGATPRGGSEVYLERGPYALIRSQNIYNDGFHHDGLAYIGEQHAAELANVEVLENDVLLNITGDSVARACQVDRHVLPARVNQHVAIIRPDPQKLDPRFLRYFLVSPEMQSKLLSWAGSGGTRNALTKGMIESFDIPAPDDVNEQRAIAHILGTLDDKIELNRRMSETLEAVARALFKSWFVDFAPVRRKVQCRDLGLPKSVADLFPDAFEESEVGEIPKGWGSVPLPAAIDVNPTRSLRKGEVAPYLDMANMPTRGHSPDGVSNRSFGSGMRFVNGDTLVARITPCLENGKTAYVDFLQDGQVAWGSTEYIVLRSKPPLPPEFSYCLARSGAFRDFAVQAMTGTSGRQRVPAEALSHFMIALPPQVIAEPFGRIVRPLFARARDAVLENHSLAALRDSLVPKLISGELRVEDPKAFIPRT
jgi:type I restriction enzyme S subunit